MIDILFEQFLLLIVSLVSNLLSSLAGGGAGLIQLPALIFLGLPFSTALVTHKIASVALGVGASFQHVKAKTTELKFCLFILACGLPGVITGARLILEVDEQAAQIALGCLTIGLGVYSIIKKNLGSIHQAKNRNFFGFLFGGLVLFIIGALNGSLTSGTGLFVTIWLITWFGLDYKHALGYTMILVGMFWNGTGAITLALQTTPKWSWLLTLIVGSLVGGYFGAKIAIAKGNPLIKRIFEAVTLLVGVALISKAIM